MEYPKITDFVTKNYLNPELIQDDKYFYLYKFVSFDEKLLVLDIIKKQVLKYTKPKFLDDKYENDFKINWAPFLKSEGISKEDNAIFKQKNGKKFEEFLDAELSKKFKTELGVCSLTSDPFNTTLWANYTNNNEGFLIEFKFPLLSFSDVFHLNPIALTYKPTISKINGKELKKIFDSSDQSNDINDTKFTIIQKILLTKASNWKFLKEYRMLELFLNENEKEEENIILRNYPLNFLSSIILGMNISDEHKSKVYETVNDVNKCHDTNIMIYNSTKHPNKSTKYITLEGHPRIK